MEQGNAEETAQQSLNRADPKPNALKEWIKAIVIAALISLPIRYFIAEPFIVEGASMDPTFASGQFLIVDRISYRFDEPKRDDVIIFEYPNNPKVYYIKRIIGLPNETIDIRDGKVTVTSPNGASTTKLTESFIDPGHASHDSLHEKLGPGEYFVMGDNRAQSADSRYWGPLKSSFIVGRPVVRLWPLDSLSILPGEYKNEPIKE